VKRRFKKETLDLAKKLNELGDFMQDKSFPSLPRVEKDLYYD